ncbi:hypothetical protein EV690_1072 [Celerinatantimonas diazotrophica]|uniref:Uncharacterized protein n=1 Tax=Celerinatantimonas diazotrophica TaxID=412034 RepID=A0A4R1K466_9GAMM|nr:hypothetical protein EV690_1072 [Celerinatantimonas diazotrophica]CAG9297547.1 hypothetical protein CEDIAZO_02735 [Celerinatantimonas diazotrophica]
MKRMSYSLQKLELITEQQVLEQPAEILKRTYLKGDVFENPQATKDYQGERMSVFLLTELYPALKTASSMDVFIMQRFCLPMILSLVGSARNIFNPM